MIGLQLRNKILVQLLIFLTSVYIYSGEGEKVLVVVNDAFPASMEVGNYYAAKRGVPQGNICHVISKESTSVNLETYKKSILEPVRKTVSGRISYIVLTFKMPFKLDINGTSYSLDSFLCFPFDEINSKLQPPKFNEKTGSVIGYNGEKSPFFRRSGRFSSNGRQFLVTRLDGVNIEIAKGLVDRAIYGEANISPKYGKGYFDQNGYTQSQPEQYKTDLEIEKAYELSKAKGYGSDLEQGREEYGEGDCPEALWYYGWYKYNHYNDAFKWKPGAVGIHLDSASCLSPRGGANWVANALKRGITAAMGTVSEPYLHTFTKADIFYKNLLNGANFAESAYYATPALKWMMCMVGDPIYNPVGNNIKKIKDIVPAKFISLSFEHEESFPTSEITVKAESDKFTDMKIEYGENASCSAIKNDILSTLKHRVDVSKLKENTEYYFKVTLTDMYKNSEVKEGRFKTTSILLPSIENLKAEPGNGRIHLTWGKQKNASISGYRVFKSLSGFEECSLQAEVKSDILEFEDKDVKNNVLYDYYVKSFDKEGNISSKGDKVTASATNLVCAQKLKSEIKKVSVVLSWEPVADKDVGYYLVYKKEKNGDFEKYRKVFKSDFSDIDVKKGDKYWYKIRTMGKNDEEGLFTEQLEVNFK
ncbi:MAG: TIGR03790 family protein [Candidatus Firestonebacteria bacterium]